MNFLLCAAALLGPAVLTIAAVRLSGTRRDRITAARRKWGSFSAH